MGMVTSKVIDCFVIFSKSLINREEKIIPMAITKIMLIRTMYIFILE